MLEDGETDGETLLDGLTLADGDTLLDGETEGLTELDGDGELLALLDGLRLADGETLADGLILDEGEPPAALYVTMTAAHSSCPVLSCTH